MLHIQHFLSLQKPPLLSSIPSFSLINRRNSGFQFEVCDGEFKKKRGTIKKYYNHRLRAVERDSEFEVDPDKAREALRKLDQQLQSLSHKKQINPPKIRAPDLKYERGDMREAAPEISGPFLAYFAFGLLLFSIFYNVLFLGIIKPAIDGPDSVPATTTTTTDVNEAPRALDLEKWLPMPEVLIQP